MVLGKKDLMDLMSQYHIQPSKSLGQNFVTDPNTIHRIIRAAELSPGDQIVEIGSGLGSLTSELSKLGKVVAIEFDRFLLPAFSDVLKLRGIEKNVEILHADAMSISWPEFFSKRYGSWKMISNLPYNIASPLLITLLEEAPEISEILVMVQKEVAERFAATPRTSAYGIPSVKSQHLAEVTIVGKVSPEVFYPKPRVDSALLRLKRRTAHDPVDREAFNLLLRKAFTQRRKMIRKSIGKELDPSTLMKIEIDPKSRPEELTVAQWVTLANSVDTNK